MEREASITIRIDRALRGTLEAIQTAFGTPISEQVRRALREWVDSGSGKELAETAKKAAKKK